MRYRHTYFIFMLLAISITSIGQVPDMYKFSRSDSERVESLLEMSDNSILLNILNIHSQIMDNMTQMMGLLFVEQKVLETKVDSLLNCACFNRKKDSPIREYLNSEKKEISYSSLPIESTKQSPMIVLNLYLSNSPSIKTSAGTRQSKIIQEFQLSKEQSKKSPDFLNEINSQLFNDDAINLIITNNSEMKRLSRSKVENLANPKINYKDLHRSDLFNDDIVK